MIPTHAGFQLFPFPVLPFRTLFLLAGMTLWVFCGKAQEPPSLPISGNYSQLPLSQILDSIGGKYAVRFYISGEVPPVRKSVAWKDVPLKDALGELLSGTRMGFLAYREYAVLVADRDFLQQGYNKTYYDVWQAGARGNSPQIPTSGEKDQISPSGQAVVTGLVLEEDSLQPVARALVRVPALGLSETAGNDGRFRLTLPVGTHTLLIQYIDFEALTQEIQVYNDGEIRFVLRPKVLTLEEVVLEAQAADANVSQTQISITRVDMKNLEKLPAFLGEADVIQALLLQPGVNTVGEGSSGFNVRGGNADQNLILHDEAMVFNASHALGFFSTFNPDLIQSVALYKGNIPAEFGGRLASVLDVDFRDGSSEKLEFKGGISPVSSRLSVEAPFNDGKTTVIAGFRSSYSDWILQRINVPELQQSAAFFYDGRIKVSHQLSARDRLTVSVYATEDDFTFADDFGFAYGTQDVQANYFRGWNEQLTLRISGIWGQYQSEQKELGGITGSVLENALTYLKGKASLNFNNQGPWEFKGGTSAIRYDLDPGTLRPEGVLSKVIPEAVPEEQGLEWAGFFQAGWNPSPRFSLLAGFRMAGYHYLGPQTLLSYPEGIQPSIQLAEDTLRYQRGKIIHSYFSPEPRLSARFSLTDEMSLKAGYSRTAQFINQVSNTTTPTPTQIWQLSTPYIAPTRAHTFSLGLFRNANQNLWESAIEVYYRNIDHWLDFKDFADLTTNDHIETEILPGRARAYGVEVSLNKNRGRLTGGINYTYSRTESQVSGINGGAWYPTYFDRPHVLSFSGSFAFNLRNVLSVNFNYRSGTPNTLPVGSYQLPGGLNVPDYSLRNQSRIPDYHRMDISYTLGRSHKKTAKFKTSWTLAVYNVYGRRNAFSVYYTQGVRQAPRAQRFSVIGAAFPSLTLNFELL